MHITFHVTLDPADGRSSRDVESDLLSSLKDAEISNHLTLVEVPKTNDHVRIQVDHKDATSTEFILTLNRECWIEWELSRVSSGMRRVFADPAPGVKRVRFLPFTSSE